MSENIAKRIREIISKESGVDVDKIADDSDFTKDLQMDSLMIIEASMAIEEEFGVNIPDEEINQINTVGRAIEAVKKHLGDRAPAC